mmetsp:Transcript_13184/g.30707  ORF Transcript_13184/g.30707 Transcript_13184/m.30707 type:complete len:156 (-) Transcript_13184:311-778(-)
MRRWILCFLLLCFCTTLRSATADEESPEDVFAEIKQYYEQLPPAGKVATAVALGYTSSHAVRRVFGVVKVVGTAYIASEVLEHVGAFNSLNANTRKIIDKGRNLVLKTFRTVRIKVREYVNPGAIKELSARAKRAFQEDKPVACGFCVGAVVGIL